MKKLLPSLLAMTTFASFAATPAATAIPGGQPAQHSRTLFFAGASTLDEHGGDESRFASWGSSLRPFLREGCAIVNYGRSGRSTTSFIREGWWGKIVEALNPGDFVIVQFGHNDQKLDKPDVATPIPQYKENLRQMAADVREKGATPVFATPIVRLTYGDDGLLTDLQHLDDWAEAMREVAKEEGVDLVDMREMTRKAANDAGEEEALTWNAPGDRTHPAVKGARRYAQLFLHDAKRRGLAVAGLFIDAAAAAPGVALSVVEKRPGYNSWPMIQAVGDTLVCAYGRGKGHFVESSRGAYAHTSSDGGRTWSPEVCIANDPVICEGVEGAGLDSSGAALFWMNCRGRGHIRHELCRTEDGVTFTKIAAPEMSPEPIQVTDIFTVPGVGLMSLWFIGDYNSSEPCNSWGTLVSRDDGKTWTQRTVESGLAKADWPTEPSAAVLPDGRILAVARTEVSRAGQLQLLSADGGQTWTKRRTNITDVGQSTPSLILDAARGLVHCYYFERGPGLLKRRTARVADILADPASWPEPEVLALGGKVRPYDSGNANATAIGDRHFVAYYVGDPTNAAVVVAATEPSAQPQWPGFTRGMGIGGWLTNYKRFNSLPQKWRLDITRGDLEHFDSYITERDVENIKSMGFDHVRLGFDQIVLEEEPGKWREGIFGKLREFVGWCDRHGLNVVLNLHKAVGNYCDIKEEVSLLDDEGLQRRFINLWLELESRFSDAPDVAFELMNEVRDIDPAKWNDLADRTIRAIRERNPNRWIVVGPTRWNAPDKLGVLKVWDDPRVVYTFHVYEPFEFTHQRGVLQAPALYPNMVLEYPCADVDRYRYCRRLAWGEEDRYPDDAEIGRDVVARFMEGAFAFRAAHPDKILWCGEFGTIRHAPAASRVAWMRDVVSLCREHGIPWCVWNYLSTPNDGNRFSLVDDDTRQILSPELLRACLGE